MGYPNRLIRAAANVPWAACVELIASGSVSTNDIVIVNGRVSGHMQAVKADADAVLTSRGRLYVAVGPAASGGRFLGAPWKFVTDVDTSGWSAVGDPVYMSGTAGEVAASAGAFSVQVGEALKVDASTGAYILAPNSSYGGGTSTASFGGLSLTINDDAIATSDEDPVLILLGGDGGAEKIYSMLRQDSSADHLYLWTSDVAPGTTNTTDRSSHLTIGPPGDAVAVTDDIDALLTLRGHVNGDAVGSWNTATLSYDAGTNTLKIAGSHASMGIDIDAGGTDGAIAVDAGGTISIDSGDTLNLTMTANAGGNKTLSVDAINAGAGDGILTLTADDNVNLGDGGNPTLTLAGTGNIIVSSNKTLLNATNELLLAHDDVLLFADPTDTSKRARLDCGLISATSTRDINVPDYNVPLAGIPFIVRKQVTPTDLTETTVNTPQAIAFDSPIPANALVIAAWLDVDTEFSGGGATAVTVDLGDGTDTDGYFDGEDVFTASGPGFRTTPGASGTLLSGGDGNPSSADIAPVIRTPNATFAPDAGHALSALTAGSLWAYVCYVAVPAGAAVA